MMRLIPHSLIQSRARGLTTDLFDGCQGGKGVGSLSGESEVRK